MKLLLTAALACAAIAPAALAANPWDGTWKLDQSKSHYAGPTFSYLKNPDGSWTVTDDATIHFKFTTDGKPHPTIDPQDTMAVTMDNDHAWTQTAMFNGKTISKTHDELSADGKNITEHTVNYRPDGSTAESESLYTRLSGTQGFAGKWKTAKVQNSAADGYIVSSSPDGTMKWVVPSQKAIVEGKPDGKPLPITGPTSAPGLTLAMTAASPHSLKYKVAVNGKPLGEGIMTLANDGKSFTDSSWSPGKESEKTSSFYARQ